MSTTIVNLNQLVSNAASNYIQQNELTFKSDVAGPAGPAGVDGNDGAQGIQGLEGKSSYDIWLEEGNSGSTTDYINAIKGAKGDKGDQGIQGIEGEQGETGEQGISVHHVRGTNTTDPEGDFDTPGETDTYTLYGDADELINLGYFSITNGDSAYQYAVDGGFTGTVQEFIDILGMIDDVVDTANNAITVAQGHANSAELSAQLAEKWAEENEDTEVEVGRYSAKHHATKAIASSVAAANSEAAASSSESNAASSASNASTSAGNASTSASQASGSASAAATSESNAATSESNASTSANSASTSAGEAAASAVAASDSEAAAAISETNAANSAASASSSAANAATSEANAAIILGSKQDTLVSGTNIKTINGETVLGSGDLSVTPGSGGYAANVYLTALDSTTNPAYKQISYVPNVTPTTIVGVANNNEVLLEEFIFDGDVKATSIPAGTWGFSMYGSTSSSNQDTYLRFSVFTRTAGGVETELFSHTSKSLDNVTTELIEASFTAPSYIVSETDRVGIRIYGSTTRTSDTTITVIVGDGEASYFTTPLEIRHNQLRNREADDAHPITSITGLQAKLDAINTYTESATAPSTPKVGDEWLDTANEVLYKRVSDGVTAVWLQTNGGKNLQFNSNLRDVVTITTSYTIASVNKHIFVDAVAGNIVVTLPSAIGNKNKFGITRVDNSSNIVSIVNVPGISNLLEDETLDVLSDGTQWRII